jgi:hypothetical protein
MGDKQDWQQVLRDRPVESRVTPEENRRLQEEQSRKQQAIIVARQRRDAEQAREQEQRRREEAAARLTAYRGQAERSWLDHGGTRADFERAWPELKDTWLKKQVATEATAVERAKEDLRTGPLGELYRW